MSPKRFFQIQLMAMLALSACAVTVATIVGIAVIIQGEDANDVLESFFATLAYGALGILPVLIYGAPLYAFADANRRATWPIAITIGALPGVVLFGLGALFDPVILLVAIVVLPSGLLVASCTHILWRKREVFCRCRLTNRCSGRGHIKCSAAGGRAQSAHVRYRARVLKWRRAAAELSR
jgi:hypothetical protein